MMEEAAIMKYALKMEDLRKVYEYILIFHSFYLIICNCYAFLSFLHF